MSAIPRVSVVLPVHDGGPFLREAVASILSQSYADLELLAVDDGSTDASGAILDEIARSDGRVRVWHQDNKGLIATLNRCIEMSRGEFVARMDADDVALPCRLEAQIAFLDRHPSVGVVGGRARYLGPRGPMPVVLAHPTDPGEVASRLASSSCLVHPTVVARREVLTGAGGYRPAFAHAEDYDLWLRVSERTALANIREIVLLYRVHGGQVSHGQVRQQALSTLAARACATARRSREPDPSEGRSAIVDEAFVRSLGLAPDTVADAVVDAFVYRAGLLGRLGFDEAAEGLASRLTVEPLPPASRRRARAEASWILGRVAWWRGERIRAARHVGGALLRRPSFASNLIRMAAGPGRSRASLDASHVLEP